MTRSENIGALAAALCDAQAKFPAVKRDRTAKIVSTKGQYSYTYADLASVLDAIRPVLSAAKIAIVQAAQADGAAVRVSTVLAHESGEWIEETMQLLARDDSPQSIGSAITYARRYGLAALVGIAPEEDDDASAAQPHESRGRPAPAVPPRDVPNGAPPPAGGPKPASEKQQGLIRVLAKQKDVDDRALRALVADVRGLPIDEASMQAAKGFTSEQASRVIDRLKRWGEQEGPPAAPDGAAYDPDAVPF